MTSILNKFQHSQQITSSNVSIVIPVFNGGDNFQRCMLSLEKFITSSTEIIVVVDGSTDESQKLAEEFGTRLVVFPTSGGPARARNYGARIAQGDIILFIDADVTISNDIASQIANIFNDQPDLAALIGSYDDKPGASNFLSQYKNLFHHHIHQTASEDAFTFWGACGAVRRHIFMEMGGFDEAYRDPSVEDIELGYRLKKAGYQIQLCRTLQVKHLKQWQVVSLLKAEFFYRALPWTELLWRNRQFTTNDLNLKFSSQLSLILTYGILAAAISAWLWPILWVIEAALILGLLLLNLPVYKFFYQKKGFWFAIRVIPWHWLYFFYGGLAFVIGTTRYHLFNS
jgi:glycosyltransferase involved in cell wall biosynthesis